MCLQDLRCGGMVEYRYGCRKLRVVWPLVATRSALERLEVREAHPTSWTTRYYPLETPAVWSRLNMTPPGNLRFAV